MMMKFRSIARATLMVIGLCAGAAGQGEDRGSGEAASRMNASDVVVKKDRFSGATTITLKPQKLTETSRQLLMISADSKIGGKPLIGLDEADERVTIKFDLQTTSALDKGDQELHFLVDGAPVKGGSIAGGGSPLLAPKPAGPYTTRRTYFVSLSVPTLGRIARGKSVEMRFGSIEARLKADLLNKLGEFVTSYERAKGNSRP